MPISAARGARLVRRSALLFEPIADPRRGEPTHALQGMLSLLVASLASNKLDFRGAEDFASDIEAKMLRRLGLKNGSPSDTAMYELVGRLQSTGFREVLWDQVRADLDSKAVTNDLFARGVMTFDGKGAGSGLGDAPCSSVRQSVCDDKGTVCWDAYALRACLTSSLARPVLDQEFIQTKGSEPPAFRLVFARLSKRFPKLFRYVTADANMTGQENAELVSAADKVYVFGLKGNRKRLYEQAKQAFAGAVVLASTTERARGEEVRRELLRAQAPATCLHRATEFWLIRQTHTAPTGKVSIEERYFVTSIPPTELTDDERLRLVRLHWGIENGPNWTDDVLLKEDTKTPCATGEGVVVMSWLRALAYNLVSIFRAHLPRKDRMLRQWKRCTEMLRDVFVLGLARLPQEEAAATLG